MSGYCGTCKYQEVASDSHPCDDCIYTPGIKVNGVPIHNPEATAFFRDTITPGRYLNYWEKKTPKTCFELLKMEANGN